jgi:membrane protease YdiL (CAAX protease family)
MPNTETPIQRYGSTTWWSIWAFLLAANAITWLACLLLRSEFASGHLWALFTFIFITVWSPTAIALALSFRPNDAGGICTLLRLVFRRPAGNKLWYLISILVPIASVVVAILIARYLHSGAPFIPLAALPLTLALQIFTGAMGEELGWRGFLLSRLENKVSPQIAAALMGIAWALWHLPSFFFPGMPQQHMPPAAFLLMVAAFGVFLALLFNRTRGSLVSTMLAHFCFNMSLAVGGAILGSTFIWALTSIFAAVAIWALLRLRLSRHRFSDQ